jgi:hypothetical protein
MKDWATIRKLASATDKARLPHGKPAYMGYITSAYKVRTGKHATDPHADWEKKIAPRVRDRIIEVIKEIDPNLVPQNGNKLGQIKHYQSLAASAQQHGVAIGKLRGLVNPGNYMAVDEAAADFRGLAKDIAAKAGL